MTVKIVKCDINWREIKNLCRTTMGKQDTEVEPSDDFKKSLLISEHSPIRHSLITIDIEDVPYYIMGHCFTNSVAI